MEGDEAHRLRELFKRVHALPRPRTAVCLSGGGIRSASYSLGVIQAMAQHRLLPQIDYLSTVSGGGYIGSWLTAWIYRHDAGLKGVSKELADGFPSRSDGGAAEPGPVIHLRDYANYLSPRSGVSSLDTLTLVATYVRNLLLNWAVLVPLMATVLLLPYLYEALVRVPVEHPVASVALRLLTSILWVSATVTSILWAPSFKQSSITKGPPDRDDSSGHGEAIGSQARLPGPRAITGMVVIPVTLAAALSCWGWVWRPDRADPPSFLLAAVLAYAVGAAVAIGFAWARSGRRPPVGRIVTLFVLSASFAVAASTVPRACLAEPGAAGAAYLRQHAAWLACLGVPAQLAMFILMLTLIVGVESRNKSPTGDDDREWWGRLSGAILRVAMIWATLATIAIYPLLREAASASATPPGTGSLRETIRSWIGSPSISTTVQPLAVAVCLVAAAIGLLGGYSTSSGERRGEQDLTTRERLFAALPSWAARVCILLVLMFTAAEVRRFLAYAEGPHSGGQVDVTADSATRILGVRLGVMVTALAVALGAGRLINVNRLSLHAIYRNRLIRAFLGASRFRRGVDPFTNFDPADNLPMHHLRKPAAFRASDILDAPRLADFFLRKDTTMTAQIWKMFRQHDAAATLRAAVEKLGKARSGRSGTEGRDALRTLRELLVGHLNELLARDDLHTVASVALTDPEIRTALRRLPSDARTHLLNRLILERECSVEPEGTDRPGGRIPLLRSGRVQRPLHVLNLALNLVSARKLSWQQRKAGSFTVSPLHCGYVPSQHNRAEEAVRGGFRPSAEYGGGITLGTAAAISGAAASPNMGYHSSPAVTFLMMLFNVRLGWWLGNPAKDARQGCACGVGGYARSLWCQAVGRQAPQGGQEADDRAPWKLPFPRQHLRPFIDEALGRTNDDNEYLYLSDGGHFENLGLYEMVRRRCGVIIVVDATCDPKSIFADLGNAISQIRIDFGIRIRMDKSPILPDEQRFADRPWAMGTIDYKAADGPSARDGVLIYIKAVLTRNMPVELFNYSKTSVKFPHERTSDQFFTERQFESYRGLGNYAMNELCAQAMNGRGPAGSRMPLRIRHLAGLHTDPSHRQPEAPAGSAPTAEHDATAAGEQPVAGKKAFALVTISKEKQEPGVFCIYDGQELIYVGFDLESVSTGLRRVFRDNQLLVQEAHWYQVEVDPNPQLREAEIIAKFAKEHGGRRPKFCTP